MYGGLRVSEGQRIKDLEEENRKLKQLAGGPALVIETLKEQHQRRGALTWHSPFKMIHNL
jgi:hypothetical protein